MRLELLPAGDERIEPLPNLVSHAPLSWYEVSFAELVEQYGKEYHRTEHDFLRVRLNVEQIHEIVQHADEQRADERPHNRTPAAHERRAADHDRGDGLQFVTLTGLRNAGAQTPCEQEARQSGKRTADDVNA